MGIGEWGSFLNALIDKLPIQDRKERWKNKLRALKKERKQLLKGEWNEKKGRRLDAIDRERDKLVELCKNALK